MTTPLELVGEVFANAVHLLGGQAVRTTPLGGEAAIESVAGELGGELVEHRASVFLGGRSGMKLGIERLESRFLLGRGKRAAPAKSILKVDEELVVAFVVHEPAVFSLDVPLIDDELGGIADDLIDAIVGTESDGPVVPRSGKSRVEVGKGVLGVARSDIDLVVKLVDRLLPLPLDLHGDFPVSLGLSFGFRLGKFIFLVERNDFLDLFLGEKVLAMSNAVEKTLGVVEAVEVVDEVELLATGERLELLVAEKHYELVPDEGFLLGRLGKTHVGFVADDVVNLRLKEVPLVPGFLGKFVEHLGAELTDLDIPSALDGPLHALAEGFSLVQIGLGNAEVVDAHGTDLDDEVGAEVLHPVAHGKMLVLAQFAGEIAGIFNAGKAELVILGAANASEIHHDLLFETLPNIFLSHFPTTFRSLSEDSISHIYIKIKFFMYLRTFFFKIFP